MSDHGRPENTAKYQITDMTTQETTPKITDPPCKGCGGSGQISFFRGVSRFVMDWDDCPDCHGTGLEPHESDALKKNIEQGKSNPNGDTSKS